MEGLCAFFKIVKAHSKKQASCLAEGGEDGGGGNHAFFLFFLAVRTLETIIFIENLLHAHSMHLIYMNSFSSKEPLRF